MMVSCSGFCRPFFHDGCDALLNCAIWRSCFASDRLVLLQIRGDGASLECPALPLRNVPMGQTLAPAVGCGVKTPFLSLLIGSWTYPLGAAICSDGLGVLRRPFSFSPARRFAPDQCDARRVALGCWG